MLVHGNPLVSPYLLAGVDLEGEALQNAYLFPPTDCFSVARPDLHYTGQGVFASENDEMPGAFAEVCHIDHAYGINQDRWRRCFDWLCKEGPILFLVSHDWSRVYVPEIKWLVEHLQRLGYPAHFLTTDSLDELNFVEGVCCTDQGVFYKGELLGTMWRQFPIFETREKLAQLVRAAREGLVRLVPEFAHFGNKVWFSLFWKYQEFFSQWLGVETFALLQTLLPDSHLIVSKESFPCTVAGFTIESLQELRKLPQEVRNQLVLKICGANTLSARSYGVFIPHGFPKEAWQTWLDERIQNKQPFIVQRWVESSVERLPVKNIARNTTELFGCRILLRPWLVGNEVVSVSCYAVPARTFRVHGRVDMAVVPVEFGSV